MKVLVDKAIATLKKLPIEEQERYARMILDEIADDDHWNELCAKSAGRFSALVAKVYADDDAGLVDDFNPDELPD